MPYDRRASLFDNCRDDAGPDAFVLAAQPAQAADQQKLEAFLEVTGFDVALESIRLSPDSAPQMLGIEADAFGSEWSRAGARGV